jgi:hypothetical protein
MQSFLASMITNIFLRLFVKWAANFLLFWQQKWTAEINFLDNKNYFFEQQGFIF